MALTADQIAEVRAWIGAGTPPSDDDLATAYDRLGSTNAVALEVLQGRYADALSGPQKWSVEGDFSIDNTETVKALAKQVAELKAILGTGGVMTAHCLTRSDPWR